MGHTITYISVVVIALLIPDVTPNVSCSAGTFSEGSKGFVRCEFGKDVRQGTHQISVVHCGTDACSSKTYPLACSTDKGKLECPPSSVLPGYTFDGQVDSSLTLVITNLTEQTAGVYMCQVHPNDGSSVSTCKLTITGPPTVTSRTPMSDSSTTRNPENEVYPESEKTAEQQGCPAVLVGLLLAGLFVLVVCGLLLAFLFFIRCKNIRRREVVVNGTDTNCFEVLESLAVRFQFLPRHTPEIAQVVPETNDTTAQCDPQVDLQNVTVEPEVTSPDYPQSTSATIENQAPSDQDAPDGNENDVVDDEFAGLLGPRSNPPGNNRSLSLQRREEAFTSVLTKDFKEWDNNEVRLWLKQVGLERFLENFKNMTGRDLVNPEWQGRPVPLDAFVLESMGITKIAEQKAVQKKIQVLIDNYYTSA